MGMFLSLPNVDKVSERGTSITGHSRYGVSSMQGWRVSMEDSHIILPAIGDNNIEIYGVFDGHGGSGVAQWTSRHFRRIVKKCLEDFKKQQKISSIGANEAGLRTMADSLKRTFFAVDEEISTIKNRVQIAYTFASLKQDSPPNVFTVETVQEMITASVNSGPMDAIFKKKGISFDYKPIVDKMKDKNESNVLEAKFRRTFRLRSIDSLIKAADAGVDKHKFDDTNFRVVDVHDRKVVVRNNSNRIIEAGTADDTAELSDTDHDHEKLYGTVCEQGGVMELNSDKECGANPETCGATAVVCAIVWSEVPYIVTANAGDSRAVLCRNGIAVVLSRDHKPLLKCELDRIIHAGGKVSEGRVDGALNLSRSLGDLYFKQNKKLPASAQKITANPDISVTKMSKDDEFLVVACDGVWDCLNNQQVVNFVRSRLQHGMEPEKIAEEIFDYIVSDNPFNYEGLGSDNMTCLIVVFSDTEGNKNFDISKKFKATLDKNDTHHIKSFEKLNDENVTFFDRNELTNFTDLEFCVVDS